MKDEESVSPPHVPNKQEIAALCAAAADGNDAVIAQWLKLHGEQHINAKDFYGWTALMAAAREGRESTVNLLLSCGAEAGITDDHGKTAADYARKMNYSEVAAFIDQGWALQKQAAIKMQEEAREAALKQEVLAQQRALKKKIPKFNLK